MTNYILLALILSIVVLFVLYSLEKNKTKNQFQQTDNNVEEKFKISKESIEKVGTSLTVCLDETCDKINKNIQSLELDLMNIIGETDKKINNIADKVEFDRNELENLIQKNTSKLESMQNEHTDLLKQFTISKLNETANDINEKIAKLIQIVDQISLENHELKKRLAFFTEIEADSKNLNETEDYIQRESYIQDALNEIQTINISKEQLLIEERTKTNDEHLQDSTTATKDEFDECKSNTPSYNLSILDEEQQKAFDIMESTSQNIFITGKAGTGKSFLLEVFVRASNKKVLKLAPTGVAALKIEGVTIHSAFGYYNMENLTESQISTDLKLKSDKQIVLKMVDAIIIDEISMVRSDKFEKIDKILRKVNGNNLPFGGKQIIVFGDLFQLPPIAKFQESKYLYNNFGGVYFFYSKAYNQNNFKNIELTVNHRQKGDLEFINILNRMREGLNTEEDILELNKRNSFNNDELRRVITLFPTKVSAEQKNECELAKIESKEYFYEAKILLNATNDQIPNLESAFPISCKLKLKLGALIMMVTNDANKKWVNGTLGIVSFINQMTIKVRIDGYEYEVQKKEFTSQEATYKNGKIYYEDVLKVIQYPLVLAYAITIHKAQGMTYPKVACDISNCFSPGQAYVAISRCSSLQGLYLLKKISNKSTIQVDSSVKDFYLNLIN